LKNPTKEKESIFQENEIATCGVIFTELLRGSKNPKESEKLKTALECFEYLTFEKQDWLEVASLFAKLKKSGLTIPFQDGIIAYLAIKNDCQLWTLDNHFKLIKTVVPVLKLF
jgi:predicted nucleic acid-binding protein